MTDASYSTKVEHYFSSERREMLPYIPEATRRLLEVGCGNAAFAAHLKSLRKVEVTAIEGYGPAVEVARNRVDRLIAKGAEEAIPLLAGEQFDCIVLNDVLEHLVDPWETLKQLRPLLAASGALVASIPNVRYMPVFKEYVMEGKWEYRQHGVMDRTHLRFFTQSSIVAMFESCGFTVNRLVGINSLASFPWKFALMNFLSRGAFDDAKHQQFACVCRPV